MRFSRTALSTFIILALLQLSANGQDALPKPTLGGYVKTMQTVWVDTAGNWLTDNLLHNRMNLGWRPLQGLDISIEVRNRLLFGELVSMLPTYGKILEQDRAWLDLSWSFSSGKSHVWHAYVDRAFVDYSRGLWQFTLGRQRVNWGMNLVWNPNDVFNAYSYFDFDYEERPGTDALRIQRYTGPASAAEMVLAAGDSLPDMSIAGRYMFNWKKYDLQVIGGMVKGDAIAGVGWVGDIEGGGFRGEGTVFLPTGLSQDSLTSYVASISADYTLSGGLYMHGGFLYNSRGKSGKAGGYDVLFNNDLTAKMLSPARWSLFLQVSRPISPLIQGNVAVIINPLDGSAFMGPAFMFSLADDVDVLLSSQVFLGGEGTEFGGYGSLWFLRVRWSF